MRRLWMILSVCIGFLLLGSKCLAWNSMGHRLVAQIAYNNLDPNVKKICNYYNHALNERYPILNFVNAAPWLDTLRQEYPELSQQHYIDIPYSKDGTPVIPFKEKNALYAVKSAVEVLQDDYSSDFEKGFALRILLHIIGDLHQPLHAINQFSKENPQGDKGGNYHFLGENEVALNLHAYWDKGGGFLKREEPSNTQIRRVARFLEKCWPCDVEAMNIDSSHWAQESFHLAINNAYQIEIKQKPNEEYREMAQLTSKERLALAGCRLAALLNQLFSTHKCERLNANKYDLAMSLME